MLLQEGHPSRPLSLLEETKSKGQRESPLGMKAFHGANKTPENIGESKLYPKNDRNEIETQGIHQSQLDVLPDAFRDKSPLSYAGEISN